MKAHNINIIGHFTHSIAEFLDMDGTIILWQLEKLRKTNTLQRQE